MELTNKNKAIARAYKKTKPKQLGDLHERMQYVMEMLHRDHDEFSIGNYLWHALYDLETEVSYHEPQKPPYGRRTMRLGEY